MSVYTWETCRAMLNSGLRCRREGVTTLMGVLLCGECLARIRSKILFTEPICEQGHIDFEEWKLGD